MMMAECVGRLSVWPLLIASTLLRMNRRTRFVTNAVSVHVCSAAWTNVFASCRLLSLRVDQLVSIWHGNGAVCTHA